MTKTINMERKKLLKETVCNAYNAQLRLGSICNDLCMAVSLFAKAVHAYRKAYDKADDWEYDDVIEKVERMKQEAEKMHKDCDSELCMTYIHEAWLDSNERRNPENTAATGLNNPHWFF